MRKHSGLCKIEKVTSLTSSIFSIEIECPAIADKCHPGQFVQLKINDYPSLIWPRPFSIHNAENGNITLSLKKFGTITNLLEKKKPGDYIQVTGPLGNYFQMPRPDKDIYFIAGGVGLPPLHYCCMKILDSGHPADKIHFYSGAATGDDLFCQQQMEELGVDYVAATDDGSFGIQGYVTEPFYVELMRRRTAGESFEPVVYGCGPMPMLKRVAEISYGIPCFVSLEQLMPCGWGVCNGCAVKLKKTDNHKTEDNRNFRLARVCKEGPIFDASEVMWE